MPPGCRPPDIPFADLERSFTGNLRPAARCRQTWSLDQLQSFFMGGPQPELMLVLLATVMEIAGDDPEETRPGLEAQVVILALLHAVVAQLDRVLRPR